MRPEGAPCKTCPLKNLCHTTLEPMRKTPLTGEIYTAKPHKIPDKWLSCIHFSCPTGIQSALDALAYINDPRYRSYLPVQYSSGGGPKLQKVVAFESLDKPTLYKYTQNWSPIANSLVVIASRVVNGAGMIFSLNGNGVFAQTGQNVFSEYPNSIIDQLHR